MDINTLTAATESIPKVQNYYAFTDSNNKVYTFLTTDDTIPDVLKSYNKIEISSDKHEKIVELMNVSDKDVILYYDGTYLAQDKPNEYYAALVRSKRDFLISQTDWIVTRQQEAVLMGDTFLSPDTLKNLLAYRKALRDVTSQAGFPKNVSWPLIPLDIQALQNSK